MSDLERFSYAMDAAIGFHWTLARLDIIDIRHDWWFSKVYVLKFHK